MDENLKQRWEERCKAGNFSPAVLGKGTISVMGLSGDEPFTFPRIASLAVLDELETDEAWAVRMAEEILRERRVDPRTHRERPVYGRIGAEPAAPVKEFNPALEQTIVLIMNTGG